MKLARCSYFQTGPFWAVVDPERDEVHAIDGEFSQWAPALARGAGISALRLSGPSLPLSKMCLLPPIEPVNRVVVAGANYAKHLADDFGLASPSQPVAFLKAYGALIGAKDPIRYPPLTEELDHEVELVAVIGSSEIDLDDPLASVLGYTVGNDVSARDLQRSGPAGIGMDLFAAKSQDCTTGLGPWIVTKDEFPAGSPELRLILKVNGEIRQDGSTAEMTWDVGQLIRFVQQRSRFACGDVLFTGSPAGVGMGTGRFLNPGDVVEATIEGIGTLRNVVGKKSRD
ncbi:fumarylacetoacetate hydrolase family protein [Pseudomonas aeruginosa]|jgi:2-keto-4-pentenoate hydratase/2-oxohepta-3-ene-1,7-dioic acid hydratase in catechol pathway|uniref:fumarylacetoacetate hydrolase family protein n=1 Tax=Pseudomonas TaxID=286 RepID=UPI00053F097C|nr:MULTISPECIES: fumarylacetoacetate hydrolase family protein [Pseudomonas]EKU8922216.1 fumarylacetoacetate hydrolase family protein [Pseudomonas aeruginosa]EKU9151936.1 fumarylacetoacetate hydrolase family protein [Pseudomonas aeruginosa]EKW2384200.1 fumarylacetoacetate hydrolase family protein [Pseudomonas aeruginosa]ELB4692667.1 fumarylacetoacetate hydrolase family protein [Pseudomonas aeruginosa]KSC75638.1 hydrolase [Pseudomonas aeruginosa]